MILPAWERISLYEQIFSFYAHIRNNVLYIPPFVQKNHTHFYTEVSCRSVDWGESV